MATGLRVRGLYGQTQISENSPVNMVVYQGTFGVGDPAGSGSFGSVYQVRFAAPVTTTDQPLVFVNITSKCYFYGALVRGSPGNWIGFDYACTDAPDTGMTFPTLTPIRPSGTWFVCASVVPKSNAKVGIRMRNPNTNEIILDTGYPLVKFSYYTPTFTRTNTGVEAWWGHWQFITAIPAGAALLASNFTGLISRSDGVNNNAQLWWGFDPAGRPGALQVFCVCPLVDPNVYMVDYAMTTLWATPGP